MQCPLGDRAGYLGRDVGQRKWGQERHKCRAHSGFMPVALITLPHLSVSSAISLANAVVDRISGSPPRSVSRALIFASARPALISRLSLSTISGGVCRGAARP